MKKSLLWGSVLLALVLGLLIGRNLPSAQTGSGPGAADSKAGPSAGSDKGAKKGKGGRPVPVRIVVAKPAELNEIIHIGATVIADESVELRVETSGRISRIFLQEGAKVRKGDLLLKIADDDIAAQLRKAEAVCALARQKAQRIKGLLERQMASTEEGESADKELASSLADIDLLTAQRAKTELRAPFDGTVGLRSVSEGAYVAVGTKIADLVRRDAIKIEGSVPERAAALIQSGTVITVVIPQSGVSAEARVYALQPSLDKSTRTLSFRARMQAQTGLLPGSYVPIALSLRKSSTALVVPAIAIVADASGNRVFVVKNGLASPRAVMTGLREEDRVEIVSGLAIGDSVITDGAALVRPNGPVVPARE